MKTRSSHANGLLLGVSAYLIWGSFPLIINATKFANPFEVVVWRVVFGFLFAAAVLTVIRGWGKIIELLRSPKQLRWLAVASIFIFINWETYVVAVATGNTIESSLGYFINPLITIVFAVVFLGERLRTPQWIALGIGFIAVVVLTFDYGRPPWIAFILAISFAIYSLAKNKVGGKIQATQSFALESLLVSPSNAFVLIGFGVMTAVPLILFGAAASGIPLSTIGFIQYMTPVLQFLTAFFILREPMPAVRWVGFGLVWLSLVVLSFDAIRNKRKAIAVLDQG